MKRVVCGVVAYAALVPAAVAAEPDATGDFAVQRDEYGLGDAAFFPPSLGAPVELRGVIHSPVDLDAGPFPLVIALHGRHVTCYDPGIPNGGDPFANVSVEWPCLGNHEPIPSYLGYEYWAANLASHGYVVVSIGANGINAADDAVDDRGARARAELIAAQLELWTAFNTTAEYGTEFNGSVDLENVGLIGHSRGGEGVAAFVALDAEQNLPYTIGAALLLAPTDYNRILVAGIPLAVILPYCDGDVFDLQGAHYYDDSRYAAAGDPAPKYIFEMAGSNHNFYNTVWSPTSFTAGGATDDFADLEAFLGTDPACSGNGGSSRLGEGEQQASFVAYANAFFRTHLGGETEFVLSLRGDDPPPVAATAAAVRTSYMPADLPTERLIVNRVASEASLQTNDLGEAVQATRVQGYALCGVGPGGGIENYAHCVNDPGMFEGDLFEGRQPHVPGLAQLRLGFVGGATWTNALPAGTDVSGFRALQFRAAVDFESPQFAGPVELTVVLVDGSGVRATAVTDGVPAAVGQIYPVVPKLLLHGVRIPIAAFVAEGDDVLDTTDLARIELVFDAGGGAILISDLAFVDALPIEPDTTSTGQGEDSESTTDAGESGPEDTSGSVDPTAASGEGGTDAASSDGTGSTEADGEGDDGCGCTSGRGGPWWLIGMIALLRRRARRRRAVSSEFTHDRSVDRGRAGPRLGAPHRGSLRRDYDGREVRVD